jgi:hypothetical protein
MLMATIPDFDIDDKEEKGLPGVGGVDKSDYDQLQDFFKM